MSRIADVDESELIIVERNSISGSAHLRDPLDVPGRPRLADGQLEPLCQVPNPPLVSGQV